MATRLSIAAKSDIGRVREKNEDAYLFADVVSGVPESIEGVARFEVGTRGALVALSDGMGGHKAGEVASKMTLEALYRTLVDAGAREETSNRIKTAVEEANAQVFAAGRRPSLADMGATVTALLVEDGEAQIAEVGDSRAYVLRRGVLRPLTVDQSLAQAMVTSGQLTPEDASGSAWRAVLLQAMGHTLDLKVALGTLALRRRDLLILCSDGLTVHLSDADIRDTVLGAPTLAAACDRLVALANERGGSDNVTVVLAGVNGDVPQARTGERISDTYRTRASFDPRTAARR